ncbi:MAG: PD-(D/E)XK nuclease family protein [Alphaproteobacteria bacterium]|nr:PD-(D/E)XK nuclease family protein [Alphaproteobacteria bacterium]
MPAVYNVPSSCSFVDVLAQKLLEEYENDLEKLSLVTILLPNHRAMRELRDAFVRARGMEATILPRIRPLASSDDEAFFYEHELNLCQKISSEERMMLFVRLITARPDNYRMEKLSFAQACFLAQELGTLIDTIAQEELNFKDLEKLVPDEYAAHWQDILQFLKIITDYYPQILEERGLTDIGKYKKYLIERQIEFWQKFSAKEKVIVAGTTAEFPLLKQLVKTIYELENGEIWLSGLDKNLDDESWLMIDETHPQFELKELLEFLDVSRREVSDVIAPFQPAREKLWSEVMRPAQSTDKWRQINDIEDEAFKNLYLIDARDSKEEALAIAMLMRHNLEEAGKTTALVTKDRNLARRVTNELLCWGIHADDSAGIPLPHTPQGVFLRLIASVADSGFAALPVLSLYKHPLASSGQKRSDVLNQIRFYENNFLRADKNEDTDFIARQREIFGDFMQKLSEKEQDFSSLLQAHIRLAESLAATPEKSGADVLWAGDAGETAAEFLSSLLESASTLGKIPCDQYADFFDALMNQVTVRQKYGTHPRIRILGPIEAKLCSFDCIIISSMNEGTMPSAAKGGAWMSRPMKKEFGFPLPERAIGVLAHDFCQTACGKEVYLTRADRIDGTPMVKSRWWMRLETVINAIHFDIQKLYDTTYLSWARKKDVADKITPIEAPYPTPPLSSRPRELWASDIERLINNPYDIYASKILKLKRKRDILPPPDAADMGTIVHSMLEDFYKEYPVENPQNSEEIMLNIGIKKLDEHEIAPEIRAFWLPRIKKIVKWVLLMDENSYDLMQKKHTICEISGHFIIKNKDKEFTIAAKADRIDVIKNTEGDDEIYIIDYKTGRSHTLTEMKKGCAPQLPIEGIIASKGGFENLKKGKVINLSYWRLGNKIVATDKDTNNILEYNSEIIRELMESFDDEKNGYAVRNEVQYLLTHSDYEHLSRIGEWGITDADD